jgi:hypothetical protein
VGLYDAVAKNLPRLPVELTEGGAAYQAKVDEAKKQYEDRDPDTLFTLYALLRAEEDVAEAKRKAVTLRLNAVTQLMVDAFEKRKMTHLTLDKVGAVRTDVVPHAIVKDKEAYRKWCLRHKYGPEMGLLWQKTNQITKELLLDAQEPPKGVDAYLKITPVFTKAK